MPVRQILAKVPGMTQTLHYTISRLGLIFSGYSRYPSILESAHPESISDHRQSRWYEDGPSKGPIKKSPSVACHFSCLMAVLQFGVHGVPGCGYIFGRLLHPVQWYSRSTPAPKNCTPSDSSFYPNIVYGSKSPTSLSVCQLHGPRCTWAGFPDTDGYDPLWHALRPSLFQTSDKAP